MSTLKVDAIVDKDSGNTTTINGTTIGPNLSINSHNTQGKNVIINGNMNVAQRGTSATGIGGGSRSYDTVDRFSITPNATSGRLTMEQAGTGSSGPDGFGNCIKLSCTTADTSIAAGEILLLSTGLEGQDVQVFQKGKTGARQFAVSFYVKGNGNATYVAELYDHDNTRQISQTFSVTSSWNRVSIIFPADTTGTLDDDNNLSLTFQIWLHAGATYGGGTLNTTWNSVTQANRAAGISSFFSSTSNTFFITGLQLEPVAVSEFEHESYAQTLSKCQRYFFRWQGSAYSFIAHGYAYSNQNTNLIFHPPVPMRAIPTLSSTGNWRICSDVCTNVSSIIFSGGSNYSLTINGLTSSTSLNSGNAYMIGNNNDASATLDLIAEL